MQLNKLASTLILTSVLLLATVPGAMGLFVQGPKLLANDGAADDFFGNAVAISGDHIVIGAYGHDDKRTDSGSAYVFERNPAGTWTEMQKLLADDRATGDNFGVSVTISGDRLVIGAHDDDDKGSNSGSAYVFERNTAGIWTQAQKLLANDGDTGDRFGRSVAISGDRLVIGAQFDDANGTDSGSAYTFSFNNPPVAVIAPVADAECENRAQTVTLDGSGSSDPDGDALTYAWAGITFDDAASAMPSARFPLGSTTVTLTVTDAPGESDTATATVRVVDTLPPTIGIARPVAGAAYVLDTEVAHGVTQLPILAVGALTVAADARDLCGIVQVDFASTTGAAASDATAPYTFVSDPAPSVSGTATVTATAHDLGGHAASVGVAFVQVGTAV